ncbi:MAG TPA: HlyC/CorC family transporter [Candidatus Limivivens merdigallinarum]|uniref:HlyC/CorC family transporter n=1 Tax=Candidatus Limivivens merdigallinarum TaxID=2840859 RepID=A0A9D0ZUA8_9FIRM|nr:HlyC/CorC family transporter [Candidatus Limivivens merdigallinarum]
MIGSIVTLVILVILNAIFASAEIAVISMNDAKLKRLAEDGNKRAVKLASLTEQPAKFLATIQVAITLAGQLGSAVAADRFAGPLAAVLVNAGVPVAEGVLRNIALVVITLVLAYFNLVFGELVPKRIAMQKSEQLALGMANMLYGVSKVAAPLVALLTFSTNTILKLIGIAPNQEDDAVTEEEIRLMLAEGNEQGIIDEHENKIIQNVFEFDDISAEQLCTHRMDVCGLDTEDTMETWEQTIWEENHSFYPVYEGNKDEIIGVLDTKYYFRLKDKSRESVLQKAVKEAFFIPEDMKADTLFEKMRTERKYFAILLDEYGGMSGIITLHDLMEALVGDLYEEEETEIRENISKIEEGVYRIAGEAELSEIEKELKVELPTDQYDTFNGLVYSIIGRVPENGEKFSCEGFGLSIQVENVERHCIDWAVVTVMPTKENEEEA